MTLSDFDAIRPFEPEELPAAYDRLVANPQFRAVVGMLYPQVPFEALEKKMTATSCSTRLCSTNCSLMRDSRRLARLQSATTCCLSRG